MDGAGVVSVQDGFFQGEGFCVPDVLHFVQSLGLANIQLVLLKEAAVHDGPKFPGIFVRLGRVLTRNKKASNYLSFSCFWFYIYGTLQSNYDGIIQ